MRFPLAIRLLYVIYIFTAELQTPVLNYTELSVDGDVRNVRVNWRTPDNTTSGIEYVLSINNSTEPVTSSTLLELSFLAGVRYELTVVSQLCQGNLQSNSSNKVDIFFPGKYTVQLCVLYLLLFEYCSVPPFQPMSSQTTKQFLYRACNNDNTITVRRRLALRLRVSVSPTQRAHS